MAAEQLKDTFDSLKEPVEPSPSAYHDEARADALVQTGLLSPADAQMASDVALRARGTYGAAARQMDADFLADVSKPEVAGDDATLMERCDRYVSERISSAHNHGNVINRSMQPFTDAKAYAETLVSYVRGGWHEIATDEFRAMQKALDEKDRPALMKMFGIEAQKSVEMDAVQPVVDGTTLAMSSTRRQTRVEPKTDAEIDAEIDEHVGGAMARNFLLVYDSMRRDLSDEGVSLVEDVIRTGTFDARNAEAFCELASRDPDEADRVYFLAQSARPTTRALGTDTWYETKQMMTDMFYKSGFKLSSLIDAVLPSEPGELTLDEQASIMRLTASGLSEAYARELVERRAQRRKARGLMSEEAQTEMRRAALQLDALAAHKSFEGYDWVDRSLKGVAVTLPYMLINALPYGMGFAINVFAHMQDIEDQIIMDGGDPKEGRFVRAVGAVAWAGIEKLEFGGLFGRTLTQMEKRTLWRVMVQEGVRKIIPNGSALAKAVGKEFVAKAAYETVQEGLQGGLEAAEYDIGFFNHLDPEKRKDAADLLKDSARRIFEDMYESFGTMSLLSVGGTAVGAARNAAVQRGRALDKESIDELVRRRNAVDAMVDGTWVNADVSGRREEHRRKAWDTLVRLWTNAKTRDEALSAIREEFHFDDAQLERVADFLDMRTTALDEIAREFGTGAAGEMAATLAGANHRFRVGNDTTYDVVDFYRLINPDIKVEDVEVEDVSKDPVAPEPSARLVQLREERRTAEEAVREAKVGSARRGAQKRLRRINERIEAEEARQGEARRPTLRLRRVTVPMVGADGTMTERHFVIRDDSTGAPKDVASKGFAVSLAAVIRKAGGELCGIKVVDDESQLKAAKAFHALAQDNIAEAVNIVAALEIVDKGSFTVVDEDTGKTLADAQGVVTLARQIADESLRAGNLTLGHEHTHAIIKFAEQLGVFGDTKAENYKPNDTVIALRKLFGDPKKDDELFDEEAFADAFTAYLRDEYDFGNRVTKDNRYLTERILDGVGALAKYVANRLLGRFGLKVETTREVNLRREGQIAAFEAIRKGDFTGLSKYAGIRFTKEAHASEAAPQADTADAKETDAKETDDKTSRKTPKKPVWRPRSRMERDVSNDDAEGKKGRFRAADAESARLAEENERLQRALEAALAGDKPVVPARDKGEHVVHSPITWIPLKVQWMWIPRKAVVPAGAGSSIQERFRSLNAASQQKLRDRAKRGKFVPERLTADNVGDRGAPIVAGGNVCLSGNGRMMLLAMVAERGGYGEYLDAVRAWCRANGVMDCPAELLDQEPVLVQRVVESESKETLDRFAMECNRSDHEELTTSEKAKGGVKAITPTLMRLYDVPPSGNFMSESNWGFIRAFYKALGEEVPETMDGRIEPEAGLRVQRAFLAKLLGGEESNDEEYQKAVFTLINTLLAGGDGTATVRNALIRNGAELYALLGARGAYNIIPELRAAVETYVGWRVAAAKNPLLTLRDYVDTPDMFRVTNPVQDALTMLIETRHFNAVLKKYNELVAKQDVDAQGLLEITGVSRLTSGQLLAMAEREVVEKDADGEPIAPYVTRDPSWEGYALQEQSAPRTSAIVETERASDVEEAKADEGEQKSAPKTEPTVPTADEATVADAVEATDETEAALDAAEVVLADKDDEVPFIPCRAEKGTVEVPNAMAKGRGELTLKKVAKNGSATTRTWNLGAGVWDYLRVPFTQILRPPRSKQDEAGRGLWSGTKTLPSAVGALLLRFGGKCPRYMGNKNKMTERTVRTLCERMTKAEREHYKTVVDCFGGGGCWGLTLALTAFPNARRLVVNEFDEARLEKIRLLQTRDGSFEAEVRAFFQEKVAGEAFDRVKRMATNIVGFRAGFLAFVKSLKLTPTERGMAQAVYDNMMSRLQFGEQDAAGGFSADLQLETAFKEVGEDAVKATSLAQAFAERGGAVEYVCGDAKDQASFGARRGADGRISRTNAEGESFVVPQGDDVVKVCDPPYYRTTGYNDDGSMSAVGFEANPRGWGYQDTERMLLGIVDEGSAIVYTDEAWFYGKDYREEKNDADLGQMGLFASLEDSLWKKEQDVLKNIVNAFDHFDVAGEVASRFETLGVQHGHNNGRSKDGSHDGGDGVVAESRGADERLLGRGGRDGLQQDVGGVADGLAGEDAAVSRRGDSQGRRSGGEREAERGLAREACVSAVEKAVEAAGERVSAEADAEIRHALGRVRDEHLVDISRRFAQSAASFVGVARRRQDEEMAALGFTERAWQDDETLRVLDFGGRRAAVVYEGRAREDGSSRERLVYVKPGRVLDYRLPKDEVTFERVLARLERAYAQGYDSVRVRALGMLVAFAREERPLARRIADGALRADVSRAIPREMLKAESLKDDDFAPRGRQKEAQTVYPDASDEIRALDDGIRFSLSSRKANEYKALIARRRDDLLKDDIDNALAEIAKFSTSKEQTAAVHWFVRGAIRLPDDAAKVTEALGYAERTKKDPLVYKSPMALIETLHEFKPKEKPIDPDTVSTLSDKQDLGHGVTTYLVDESQKSQEAMRRIIDTHWGADANPWCLLSGDGKGNLTDDAKFFWEKYSAVPKRVAFKDGKLLAFCASDDYEGGSDGQEWWNREDESSGSVIEYEEKADDGWTNSFSRDLDDDEWRLDSRSRETTEDGLTTKELETFGKGGRPGAVRKIVKDAEGREVFFSGGSRNWHDEVVTKYVGVTELRVEDKARVVNDIGRMDMWHDISVTRSKLVPINILYAHVGESGKYPATVILYDADGSAHVRQDDVFIAKGVSVEAVKDVVNQARDDMAHGYVFKMIGSLRARTEGRLRALGFRSEKEIKRDTRHSLFVTQPPSSWSEDNEPNIPRHFTMFRNEFGNRYTARAREEIYAKTGWWRGVDGEWRMEIPDFKRKTEPGETKTLPDGTRMINGFFEREVNGEKVYVCTIANLAEADVLEDVVADITRAPIVIVRPASSMPGQTGYFESRYEFPNYIEAIVLSDALFDKKDGAPATLSERGERTLTHEAQHLLQRIDSTAYGASPSFHGLFNAWRSAGEVESRNAARRNTNVDDNLADLVNAYGSAGEPLRRRAMAEGRAPWQTEDVPKKFQIITDYDGKAHDLKGRIVRKMDAPTAEMVKAIRRSLGAEAGGSSARPSRDVRHSLTVGAVFDTDAWDGVEIPVASLRTYKNEPGKSVLNAARFMAEAMGGSRGKRKPISVADNGDGTYTVVDGMATSKALAAVGAATAYAKVVGLNRGTRLLNSAYTVENESPDGGVLRAENAATLDEAIAQAAENADALADLCRSAAAKVSGEVVLRQPNPETGKPTKSRASAERKLRDEYDGDVSRLIDLVGGTVIIDDNGDFGDALKAIKRNLPEGASLGRVKVFHLAPTDKGYGDIKVSVRFANGGVGEIILVGRGMFEGKMMRGGHEVYELTRVLGKYEGQSSEINEVLKALDRLSNAIYAAGEAVPDEASFAFIKAMASSSITRLIPGAYAQANLSSSDMEAVKSMVSGLNLAKPPSLRSNATPALSLMKNMDTSLIDAVRETFSRPTQDNIPYSGVGAQGGESEFFQHLEDLKKDDMIRHALSVMGGRAKDAVALGREEAVSRMRERLLALGFKSLDLKPFDERHSLAIGAQAQREYDEVVARYTNADGTKKRGWMLAPNGKPTNLTERQWVQVRTPSFKRWFGDWEKAATYAAIERLSPIAVSELAEGFDAKKAYASLANGKNVIDGREVRFVNTTLGKILRHKGYDTSRIIPHLKEIFDVAVPVGFEQERAPSVRGDGTLHKEHRNFVGYHNYVGKIVDVGRTFYVRFTVQELKTRSKTFIPNELHSTFVSDIALYSEADQLALNSAKGAGKVGAVGLTDDILAQFFAECKGLSVSKAIDENGEPLLLYHGSNRFGFTEMNGDYPFFMTDSESRASGYGGAGVGASRSLNRVRNVEQFDDIDATDTQQMVRAAKSIFGAEVHEATKEEREAEFNSLQKELEQYTARMNDLPNHPNDDSETDWDLFNDAETIRWAFQYDPSDWAFLRSLATGEASADGNDYATRWVASLKGLHDKYNNLKENVYPKLLEQGAITAEAKKYYDALFKGYETSDALIDVETRLVPLLNPANKVANIQGHVIDADILHREIVRNKDSGIYQLFANTGKNVLEIDAEGAYWTSIPFNGTTASTDAIVKSAKAQGYDSVIIRNVIDPGVQNADGDDYIVFSPSQIKSATDNTGAFDEGDADIRHSLFVGRGLDAEQDSSRAAAINILTSRFHGRYTARARDAIYIETGWWRGRDGLWRVEVANPKAKTRLAKQKDIDPKDLPPTIAIVNGLYANVKSDKLYCLLTDMVTLPRGLEKAYPFVKNLVVCLRDNMDGIDGSYSNGRITMSWDLVKWRNGDPSTVLTDDGLSTLVHELQHAIQEKDGFALGASEKVHGEKNYFNSLGEVEARNVERRRTDGDGLREVFAAIVADEEGDTRRKVVALGYAPWQTEDVPGNEQVDTKWGGARGGYTVDQRGHSVARHSLGTRSRTQKVTEADLREMFDSRHRLARRATARKPEDVVTGMAAARILAGQKVKVDDLDATLKNVGLAGLNASDVLAKAQSLAESNREKARGRVEKADPTLYLDLADDAMRERVGRQIDDAVVSGAKIADPEIGARVERLKAAHARRALDAAKGFSARQMQMELPISLADGVFAEAEYERSPEMVAYLEAARQRREEEAEAERKAAEAAGLSVEEYREEMRRRAEEQTTYVEPSDKQKAYFAELLDRAKAAKEKESARRAKRKAKSDATEAEVGESVETADGEAGGEGILPVETVRRIAPIFGDADTFAMFVAEWCADNVVKRHPEIPNTAQMWRNPVAVRELVKTAQSILGDLAMDVLGSPQINAARNHADRAIIHLADCRTYRGVVSQIAATYDMIHNSALRLSRRKLVANLIKAGDKATGAKGRFSATAEAARRTTDAKTELWWRHLKPFLAMSEERLQAEIARLEEIVNGYNRESEDDGYDADNFQEYRDACDKLALANRYGGMIRWMPSKIQTAADEILRELDGRREAFEAMRDERDAANAVIREAIIAAVEAGAPETYRKEAGAIMRHISRYGRSLVGNLTLELQNLIRYCKDEALRVKALEAIDEITIMIGKGSEKYRVILGEANAEVNNALAEIYGSTEAALKHLLEEKIPEDIALQIFSQSRSVRPTYGQLLQLYASCLQKDYKDNIERHDRADQIELMRACLTEQDMALHAWAIGWYAHNRQTISDAVEEITGLSVASPDSLYCPVRVANEKGGFSAEVKAWTPVPSALNRRVRHGLDFNEGVNFLSMLCEQCEVRAQLVGYGLAGIRLRDIIAHRDLQLAVRKNVGAVDIKTVIDHVRDVLTQGIGRKSSEEFFRPLNVARKWLARFYLSGNIPSAMKQLASRPVWANVVGFKDAMRYYVSFFTPEGWRRAKELADTDGFRARYLMGWSEETQNIIRNPSKNRILAFIGRMYDYGMWVNKGVDMLSCLWMGQGFYADAKRAFLDKGFSEEEAKDRAATLTWSVCESGQQSGRIENMNVVQRTKQESAGAIFQFMTAYLLQNAYEIQAARECAAGTPGAKGRLLRAVVINHLLIPAYTELVMIAWKAFMGEEPIPDEPDEWPEWLKDLIWACAFGPAAPLYMYYQIAKSAYDRLTGKRGRWQSSGAIPAEGIIRVIENGARLVFDCGKYGLQEFTPMDFEEEVTVEDLQEDFLRAAGSVLAPVKHATKAVKNWSE